ncbi:type VI secretion system baseplate subunit TssF [Pseudoduganella sp. FT93W]|uniref:Type VI secretion system baseplate subunit TssF n=1 Tax=Duganella fentianensis TaxID=2692177 RepID=A0A845I572_9BURK|nr:type VI secretion system baseplate subunit TssF [Duganella fentianensis]MYN46208.1 type VI secretion system baseplate subunit TssF [Duganella fentianensis]
MEDLLPYFERELVQLRQLGREMGERYPGICGGLQLGGDNCPDPHVEQLIQSVALLSARIAKKLDDSYPEFTEALLQMLFPHYLRPFPSCSIIRASYPVHGAAGASTVLTIPRGTEMDSSAVQGVRCRFKTAYEIKLSPISLKEVQFNALVQPPAGMSLPPASSASLSMVIDGKLPAELTLLRVYIDADQSLSASLRDALFLRVGSAYIEVDAGRWIALPSIPLAPVGFADDEALMPVDARSQVAYRILSEYFVFPEKFNFFDIDLASLKRYLPAQGLRFTLHLVLTGIVADSHQARMLDTLSAENLQPGCSPVVNLFQRAGHPIGVTHHTADYGLLADATRPEAFEVYSIDTVHMVSRRDRGEQVAELRPFYSLRHGESVSDHGRFWVLRHDATLAAISPGHEKRLTLVDADFNPTVVEKTSLSIALSCTNRDLPSLLPEHGRDAELTPLRDATSYIVRLLRKPSRTYKFSAGDGNHWRLISHLTVNQQGLGKDGLSILREMLALHDLPQSPMSRRQIAGIYGLESVETVNWMRTQYGASLVHGTEVRITLEDDAFIGTGLLLFVQVIDQFLGLYAQVNSFIELVILSQQTGKELIRCKPRSGYQTLA